MKRSPAGGEYLQRRTGSYQGRHHIACSREHMFAIVQNEQELELAQMSTQGLQGGSISAGNDTDGCCHCGRHQY
jgi:hypothetical protein